MKEIIYNKLIRDKIPKIIEASEKEAVIKILNDQAFIQALEVKLQEELDEYNESKEIEELADILEVIYALAESKGIDIKTLESIRKEKVTKRGSFKEKLWLEKVVSREEE